MKQFIKRTMRVIFNFQTMEEMYKGKTGLWVRSKWLVGRSIRNMTILASYGLVAFTSAKIYNIIHPVTVYADRITTVEVVADSPVMARIAKCESGGSQTKNGQILMHVNNDKSVDIGKYQINLQTWGATATKMGYDLTKESDNEAFAKWLYANKGTSDWSASMQCWK